MRNNLLWVAGDRMINAKMIHLPATGDEVVISADGVAPTSVLTENTLSRTVRRHN
jgi:hypothetical protein